MRIIGGQARGRRLVGPKGRSTRPTSDRVREALFSMVHARYAIEDAAVLDLFAGSGALGLESLSRGAASAVFVEHDRAALQAIRNNVATLAYETRSVIVAGAVQRSLTALEKQAPFDLVFADPPYAESPWPLVGRIAARELLSADGLVAIEHASNNQAPVLCGALRLQVSRSYGSTAVSLFQAERDASPEDTSPGLP